MVTKYILESFDKRLGHIFKEKRTIERLAKLIYQYHIAFVNKNQEHMEFFGSNLIGVNIIRITEADYNVFFQDILGVDKEDIIEDIKNIPSINNSFKVISSPFNQTTMYLAHKFLTCKSMPEKARIEAAKYCCLIFNYANFAKLYSWYFKYPISVGEAEAIYMNLSKKYLIKKLGTWSAVLMFRAESMIEKNGIHYKTFMTYNDDDKIIYLIEDAQGRVRDNMKNLFAEFVKVRENGEKVITNKSTVLDADGEDTLLDKTGELEPYINYILNVVPDVGSFIKESILDIVGNIIKTTQRKYIETTLRYISASYTTHNGSTEMDDFIRTVLIHAYQYLMHNNYLTKHSRDIVGITAKLRNIYISSRANDEIIFKIRDLGDKIVKDAIGKINSQAQAATRIAVILYICIRTFAKHSFE